MLNGFQKNNQAPEPAWESRLTRTGFIENSADALRYCTTGNVGKAREQFLNKFSRVHEGLVKYYYILERLA